MYGTRRLTAEVRGNLVARLMRLGAIQCAHRRRRGKYGRRTSSIATAPDLVARRFTADAPNRLWVADIT